MSFTQSGPESGVDSRIKRVEQGLLPAVLVKGDPSWSIEERMKHYKVPGLSIAVINNHKIEWAHSYGVRDIETREPVILETLFQAGSISKPVAAMVALKKVQQGKIGLDENINNKLTSWKLPDNEFTAKKKVTLTNLLSHTGGLNKRSGGSHTRRESRSERLKDAVSRAYREKYHTPGSLHFVKGFAVKKRRDTTTELVPL